MPETRLLWSYALEYLRSSCVGFHLFLDINAYENKLCVRIVFNVYIQIMRGRTTTPPRGNPVGHTGTTKICCVGRSNSLQQQVGIGEYKENMEVKVQTKEEDPEDYGKRKALSSEKHLSDVENTVRSAQMYAAIGD